MAQGVAGAERILPATFVVIVATVTLYGLTAFPVTRRLGVLRPARSRPLLVGGAPWAVDLGRALGSAGLDVLMWAGAERQRARIEEAGLALAPGEPLAAASGAGAELEGITGVLLLTEDDDFNALAAMTLRESVEGPVHRLAPAVGRQGVVAPYTGGEPPFRTGLTGPEPARRYEAGAVLTRHADAASRPVTRCSSSSAPTGGSHRSPTHVHRTPGRAMSPCSSVPRPGSRRPEGAAAFPGVRAALLLPVTGAGPLCSDDRSAMTATKAVKAAKGHRA
ncbi:MULTISPECIES: cation:proton antiporter [unclassified Streptomyces]|uniref:hypothetical protein n=1 Tax=unclassified Streptomyces TaxID=2593676 RepID=UPI0036B4C96F